MPIKLEGFWVCTCPPRFTSLFSKVLTERTASRNVLGLFDLPPLCFIAGRLASILAFKSRLISIIAALLRSTTIIAATLHCHTFTVAAQTRHQRSIGGVARLLYSAKKMLPNERLGQSSFAECASIGDRGHQGSARMSTHPVSYDALAIA